MFEVSDTGIGITGEAQARIFDSFAQADGSTSRQFGGTGLGLAISQKLVAVMGSVIDVESELGQGATFRFAAQFERECLPSDAETTGEDFDDLRVLVLDDNDANREILSRQLEAWQIAHDCASDGQAALEQLTRARFKGEPHDVVLVDRFMPSMDGLDFACLVREDSDLA